MQRFRPRAITSDSSRKTGCATTTSSIRRTGHSASKVLSATVIGPCATRTDGLSKTAFVLGPEKAMEIYNRIDDIDAIIVKLDGTVIYSKGIEPAPARGPAPAK